VVEKVVADLAANLAHWRKTRGFTQEELAQRANVSVSTIRKIEQGQLNPRMETVRKIAEALRIHTTKLIGAGRSGEPTWTVRPEVWEATAHALAGTYDEPDEPPTLDSVAAVHDSLKPLLADNRYAEMARILPGLIRDVDQLNGAARELRSRVYGIAGYALIQTRRFDLGEAALQVAIDSAVNPQDAANAVDTLIWSYLRQGKLNEASTLAVRWADDIEPRLSRAGVRELAVWGRLLLRVSESALRDNRPGEAEDALNLANAVATYLGREIPPDPATTRTYGPWTVAMIRAETAVLQDKPDTALSIARTIPRNDLLYPRAASRRRHDLDMVHALAMLGRAEEAAARMWTIAEEAGEWLENQQWAHDALARITATRRTYTPPMRWLSERLNAGRASLN